MFKDGDVGFMQLVVLCSEIINNLIRQRAIAITLTMLLMRNQGGIWVICPSTHRKTLQFVEFFFLRKLRKIPPDPLLEMSECAV